MVQHLYILLFHKCLDHVLEMTFKNIFISFKETIETLEVNIECDEILIILDI